ncbi:MAG: hypothetical protein GXP40_01005 [Chloroflexi bacterium]|nr:hypothetical protein [Chloroflexota bacterium]
MRRGRIFIYLALILLIALVAGFLFLRQASERTASAVPTPSLVEVVVAGQNIPQGGVIADDALTTVLLPQDKVVAVMFTNDQRGQLVDKIAKYPIEQGVMITRPMIVDTVADIAPSGPEWVSLVSPGMTAIAVPISRLASVAYGVGDGTHVNVIACFLFVDVDSSFQSSLPNRTAFVAASGFKPDEAPSLAASVSGGQSNEAAASVQGRVELDPTFQQPVYVVPSEEQRPRPVCQMIFQDVVVLRLGDFPVDTGAPQAVNDEPGQPQAEAPAPLPPDIVTLMVTPQDAITLTYLLYNNARLTLTMRGAGDVSRVETEAATLQFILSQYAIPVPAKLPYAVEPRINALIEPKLPNDSAGTPSQ